MTTDEKVAAYLEANGIPYTAAYVGATTRENWGCDAWRCTLAGQDFEFYTGMGHRKPDPVAPTAASLLYSLLLDRSAGLQTFYTWCAEIGYDTDSRKALAIYLACQANTIKLEQVTKPAQLAELETLLEDY